MADKRSLTFLFISPATTYIADVCISRWLAVCVAGCVVAKQCLALFIFIGSATKYADVCIYRWMAVCVAGCVAAKQSLDFLFISSATINADVCFYRWIAVWLPNGTLHFFFSFATRISSNACWSTFVQVDGCVAAQRGLDLTVPEMQCWLRAHKLLVSGKKADLEARMSSGAVWSILFIDPFHLQMAAK